MRPIKRHRGIQLGGDSYLQRRFVKAAWLTKGLPQPQQLTMSFLGERLATMLSPETFSSLYVCLAIVSKQGWSGRGSSDITQMTA